MEAGICIKCRVDTITNCLKHIHSPNHIQIMKLFLVTAECSSYCEILDLRLKSDGTALLVIARDEEHVQRSLNNCFEHAFNLKVVEASILPKKPLTVEHVLRCTEGYLVKHAAYSSTEQLHNSNPVPVLSEKQEIQELAALFDDEFLFSYRQCKFIHKDNTNITHYFFSWLLLMLFCLTACSPKQVPTTYTIPCRYNNCEQWPQIADNTYTSCSGDTICSLDYRVGGYRFIGECPISLSHNHFVKSTKE